MRPPQAPSRSSGLSRPAIVATSFLFFAVALAIALAEGYVQPLSLRSVVVTTAAIYGMSAVVLLIIWAVGRFRLQKAIAPVAVWSALLLLVGTAHGLATVVAAHGLTPVIAAFLEIPSVKKSFRESVIEGMTQSCVTGRARDTNLSDAQLEANCECAATQLIDTLTTEEMVDLLRSRGDASPALKEKLLAIAMATGKCWAEAPRKEL